MVEEKVYLTQEGLEKLKREYDQLVNVRRKEVVEKLKKARELGDISENAAFETARDEQALIEGRIAELGDVLKRVEITEEEGAGRVGVGSTVRVHLDGEEQKFQIVGVVEADPTKGKISHESPLGQSLLGKRVGEKIKVRRRPGSLFTASLR